MDAVRLLQGLDENHFDEVVYVLPLSSQKLLVLIFTKLWRMNNTNTEIWSKETSIDPYVAKMLFPQAEEGFWLAILH